MSFFSLSKKQRDVHVFVFDGMSDWETGYATAWINNPMFQKNPGVYKIRTVALTKDLVTTAGGMRIQPDLTIDKLSSDKSAMLIIPGGAAWDKGQNTEVIGTVRKFLTSGTPVAAICGATVGLAKEGLLDNRQHTSNSRKYLAGTKYSGGKFYKDEPAVTDKNLITASGMAPVEFAYQIFKRLDLYSKPVLEAWFGLFKTGNPKYFGDLMQAVAKQSPKNNDSSTIKVDFPSNDKNENAIVTHKKVV